MQREVSPSTAPVELSNVHFERQTKCSNQSECKMFLRVRAELANRSSRPIEDLVLGIILRNTGSPSPSSQELASKGEFPQNEQAVPVNGVALQPGEMRPLRITLEEAFDSQHGQEIAPQLRVLSFREVQ